jgi:hypothetical protein
VQRATHNRRPVERLGKRVLLLLLPVPDGVLERRVRQRHHMRARLRHEPEPPGQVQVQHVEAAAPELELPRLHVHDDVITDLDRSRHAGIRDTRRAVNLEPDELRMTLDDRADDASPKRERHRPARA